MALAALFNLPVSDNEFSQWSFCHIAHHRDVNAQIYRLTGIYIEEFAIDPFDPDNPGQWDDQHQAMHNSVNAVLGGGGFNLSDPAWRKPQELAGWIQSNATEHRQWADVLGVG